MKPFVIKLKRKTYTVKSTIGELYVNDEYFCYTLEDVVRGENIKIHGNTAIPSGTYKVILSMSNRFQRVMPMIYTEPNKYELKSKGISFKGIRIHGGNTHLDTHGCPLVAKNKVNDDHIFGSMEKELTEKLESLGGIGSIIITNEN